MGGLRNRILWRLVGFPLQGEIWVSHFYIRSSRNVSSDGRTRWTDREVSDWVLTAIMGKVALPMEWLLTMRAPKNNPEEICIFVLLGSVCDFYRDGRHRVCEWRPGRHAKAGVLPDWGIPNSRFGVVRRRVHSSVSDQVSTYVDEDIS